MEATRGSTKLTVGVILVSLCLIVSVTTAFAQGGGLAQMQLKKGPDLAIREIMLTGVGAGPVGANLEVSVGVLNIGQGQASGFKLALIYMSSLDMDHPYVKIEMKQVTPIMAGDGLMVSFVIPAHPGTPDKGMLIAVADPPVAGNAAGAMTEGSRLLFTALGAGRTDTNNVFGVIFDAAGHDMPIRWMNPAIQ